MAIILAVLVLLGAGCEKNAGTWISSDTFDVFEPPELRVLDIQPANGEANVAVDSEIELEFSEPIKPETISSDTIQLSYINPDLSEIELVIHYEWALFEGEKNLQITPIGSFLPGETVEFVLHCDIVGVEDQSLQSASDSFMDHVCYTAQFQVAE